MINYHIFGEEVVINRGLFCMTSDSDVVYSYRNLIVHFENFLEIEMVAGT